MKFNFFIVDVDYFIVENKPVIRLFGKNEKGKTVVLFDKNFKPYFYIKKGPEFKNIKNSQYYRSIINMEETEKILPNGFHEIPEKVCKIMCKNPQEIRQIREVFKTEGIASEVYEADILFKNRYLIDKNIHSMTWMEVEADPISTSKADGITMDLVSIINNKSDFDKPTDLRICSFDIECITLNENIPIDVNNQQIIMISLAFSTPYRDQKNLVLVAKPFRGEGILGYASEKDMLEDFIKIIRSYDPDVLTGYNINSFDLPYTESRLRSYGIPFNIGRCDNKQAYIKSIGIIQDAVVPGRTVFDPYQIIKNDPWLHFIRYDLGTIAKEMIGDTKLDVDYKEIPILWKSGYEGIMRLVKYARKDAQLVIDIIQKKRLLDKFIEISKISGVALQDTLGGQTSRIENMLLYEFRKRGYIMPLKPAESEIRKRLSERDKSGLKGATVLEPLKGLHSNGCVIVLDFKSLYPSIMRTFNISPDTLILDNDYKGDFIDTPLGSKFTSEKKRSGVFPYLLSFLLNARAEAKEKIEKSSGNEKNMLNARQLALKDMANSFYGYTGYVRARLYMIDIASAITAVGRENIEKTAELIRKNFNLQIVYGDTDSVFVLVNTKDLEEARKIGEEVSKFVSDKLMGYLVLEFEKIYRTFLILSKKRYAGWKFELSNNKWEEGIEMKGIETVRRDWCPLVSKTMDKVLRTVLMEGDLDKAMTIFQEVIKDLKDKKYNLNELTIVKGLTKDPDKYKGTLPHIEAAKKMKERNPDHPPRAGDRIGFVIVSGDGMLSKRAEDPDYIKENNLEIDPNYYIEYQLLPPIERIFSSVGISKSEIFGQGRQTNVLDVFGATKRIMKHDTSLKIEGNNLDDWDKIVCSSCKKEFSSMPMKGICECNGKLMLSYKGIIGNKIIRK